MFNIFTNSVIDAVQSAKKASVDQIPHKELKSTLVNFIDAQTKYTKDAVRAGNELFTRLGEIATDSATYTEAQKNVEKLFPVKNAFAAAASKKKD